MGKKRTIHQNIVIVLAVNTTITHLSIDEIIYQTPNTLANVLQSPSSKG